MLAFKYRTFLAQLYHFMDLHKIPKKTRLFVKTAIFNGLTKLRSFPRRWVERRLVKTFRISKTAPLQCHLVLSLICFNLVKR